MLQRMLLVANDASRRIMIINEPMSTEEERTIVEGLQK